MNSFWLYLQNFSIFQRNINLNTDIKVNTDTTIQYQQPVLESTNIKEIQYTFESMKEPLHESEKKQELIFESGYSEKKKEVKEEKDSEYSEEEKNELEEEKNQPQEEKVLDELHHYSGEEEKEEQEEVFKDLEKPFQETEYEENIKYEYKKEPEEIEMKEIDYFHNFYYDKLYIHHNMYSFVYSIVFHCLYQINLWVLGHPACFSYI